MNLMREYSFNLCRLDLCVQASCAALADPVRNLLRHFYSSGETTEAALTIRFQRVADRSDIPIVRSTGAKIVFSGTCPSGGDSLRLIWRCEVVEDAGRIIVGLHEQGVLVIDGVQGLAEGYFVDLESRQQDAYESLFHYALTEVLKRRGLFALRAAALEYQGLGVSIAGARGQGKTAAALSLLRSGFRYLSDDSPLVSDHGADIDLHPFPGKIEVLDLTIDKFSELRDAAHGVVKQGVWKKWFRPEDVYARPSGRSCRPTMILFPRISAMPYSCLEPVSKSRALEALRPQGPAWGDVETSRREFQALSKLVRQADCYRLHFGRDVHELPGLIAPLLRLRESA